MPTIRGFVERLEIGRAGLVTASLRHDDGSTADYLIQDLDADPERFNERLSKLGVLRDAMTRAEPVEVEYGGEANTGARIIERVARITRDNLEPSSSVQRLSVMIVGIALATDNCSGARAEASDIATVATLDSTGKLASYLLDMQRPERAVSVQMLEMLRQAQTEGTPVTLSLEPKQQRIAGVQAGDPSAALTPGDRETLDGFVESLMVAPTLAPIGNLALVEFTTAPPFSGGGNVVELLPFKPALKRFLVVQGSLEYELFLAGLRDKLRMRVLTGAQVGRAAGGDDDGRPGMLAHVNPLRLDAGAKAGTDLAGAATTGADARPLTLVRAVQLLAALASASRPVWIQISRQSLDKGPDGERCTAGLPSSDLSPLGLRDLHLPYTAEWVGLGCFNPGVYRLQFDLPIEFEIFVDCKPLCVHAAAEGNVRFAHACLGGDHEVRVVLHGWTCKMVFEIDVYRIR
ncbi:MAG TPA: hypothetical protein PKJ45_09460 [Rubrivivax sp.]|nr:hypothetical protein [Rubrivivax sp.]